ncbi:MAG TPA: hypothetical protein P5134_04050 [Bacteroidales bacterium]|jgi:phenylpyruvate tautomerase PptA (4-oxalocrotonate tautomerase family)|nr:hypothetical protein [Bacteroidales bacterium]HOF46533.1 hypothetical protein [Bacteroidales bacterium]HOS57305.1 hypothetical protein [Bacteroidales bacterium]HRR04202.1 hypothetical protein [Bacteroidales bacterium]HRT13762.1 hypothetical protein [Bacteroidales bacterium]
MIEKIEKINYLRVGYQKDDIISEQYTEMLLHFDEAGNIVKQEHFSPDKEIISVVLNEYNEQNHLVVTSEFDENEELLQKIEYFYNLNGKVERQNNFYGEGSPCYVTRFVYENNLLIQQEAYVEEDLEGVEKKYFYNDNNQLIKEIHFNEDGKEQYIFEYSYFENGTLKQTTKIEVLEKDKRTYDYEYDERNNRVKELIYNYNDELISKSYTKYNDENRVVEVEEEDLNQYKLTQYQYEGENVIKVSILDKNKKIISWTEFIYDESGKNKQLTQYITDEVDPESYRKLYEIKRTYSLDE